MQEFYVDVALSRGLTRIQVDEVLPEHWDMPGSPQFIIEFYTGSGFLTMTIQLEQGAWYARLPDDQSSLSQAELKAIGMAISNYMVVALQHYMGLFVPQYRTPTLN